MKRRFQIWAAVSLLVLILPWDALRADEGSKVGSLKCSPKTVTQGDRLVLEMKHPHGGQLAVEAPGGRYFFVVYPYKTPSEKVLPVEPVMLPSEFVALERFVMDIATFEATPWYKGVTSRERVFVTPGSYRIRVGENLQSDEIVQECLVRFDGPRPK